MLAHNLVNIPDDLPGQTLFADLWLQAMLDDNTANYAGAYGVFYPYASTPNDPKKA